MEAVVLELMEQGMNLKPEIPTEETLAVILGPSSEPGDMNMGNGAAGNVREPSIGASDGESSLLEGLGECRVKSDSVEESGNGREGKGATKDSVLIQVGLQEGIALPSSVDSGEGLQQPVLEVEKVDEVELVNDGANCTPEAAYSAREGLHNVAIEESCIEKEGIEASTATHLIEVECKQPKPKLFSKSAMKQLAKQERYKEIKLQKKAAEKEKRHQETARKRKDWEEKLASLTEDEKQEVLLHRLSVRKERKDEQKSRKEKLRQALETGQNLVIDLEFCELMKPNEVTSLIQQVMYSYATNTRAPVPGRISLTGVRGDIQKELGKISGFTNWLVHSAEQSYLEVFEDRKSDLVYLTADSENVLESLDNTKIYIVGGLVDRNRWKNVTLEKATKQGIATAKLPVGDHLKMMASQVLTVNLVIELLLCFLEVGDWKKALEQIVPLRKRAADESFNGSGK